MSLASFIEKLKWKFERTRNAVGTQADRKVFSQLFSSSSKLPQTTGNCGVNVISACLISLK